MMQSDHHVLLYSPDMMAKTSKHTHTHTQLADRSQNGMFIAINLTQQQNYHALEDHAYAFRK